MKKKTKKTRVKYSKTNTKKDNQKLKNNSNSKINEFIIKYPGVIFGIVIFIIVIILAIWSAGALDPYALEKREQAISIHEGIQTEINTMVESLDLISQEEYDAGYDYEYYLSIKEDLLWLKEKDLETFDASGRDLYIKEFANFIFLNRLFLLNEEFLYDFYDFDEDSLIENAKSTEVSPQDITINFGLEEVFLDEENDKDIFDKRILELAKEYELNKKIILNDASGNERKFVEAKKLLILSYTSDE